MCMYPPLLSLSRYDNKHTMDHTMHILRRPTRLAFWMKEFMNWWSDWLVLFNWLQLYVYDQPYCTGVTRRSDIIAREPLLSIYPYISSSIHLSRFKSCPGLQTRGRGPSVQKLQFLPYGGNAPLG